ncbi:MAG: (deoxy)nucleoside triphosphate pyrophosphohydrolase [Rickettsiales bacterium]
MKTVLVSAVALFDADGRVLLTQRPEGKLMAGLWEFPGGKIEAGELPEAALAREMREELGIEICENCSAPLTFVSHVYESFHLLMMLYACRKWEGIPTPLEGQKLAWKYPREMTSLPMPPADLPLVAALIDSAHVWKQLA